MLAIIYSNIDLKEYVINTFLGYQFTLYSMIHDVDGVQELVNNINMPYIPKPYSTN